MVGNGNRDTMTSVHDHVEGLQAAGITVTDIHRSDSTVGKFYIDAVHEGEELQLQYQDPRYQNVVAAIEDTTPPLKLGGVSYAFLDGFKNR